MNTFFSDFTAYLETIILSSEPLIITGDFNIHVDCVDLPETIEFLDIVESMGLKQHVRMPTHEGGHILDLLITREIDTGLISDTPRIGRFISDHAVVISHINCAKPLAAIEKISFRKINSINMDAMRNDLLRSDLCSKQFSDLNGIVECYNSTLTCLLDKYAPLQSKSMVKRKRVPWFSKEIKSAIKCRRKAERSWRVTKCERDLLAFKAAKNHATYIMNCARRKYYTDHVMDNSSDQRKLFQSTKVLFCEPQNVSFPPNMDPDVLANEFGRFFVKKIEGIHESLEELSSSLPDEVEATVPILPDVSFTNFTALSEIEIQNLIAKTATKSCPLDPMPTKLVVKLLDVLLPVITSMINLSFETCYFADSWKEALVLPLLKKPGLATAFLNFRPVNNLPFISKLSEKACMVQLNQHSSDNGLDFELQSAYKKYHSTESALLKVKSDILMNMNKQHVTLIVMLDLSSAFDTVSHEILIDRLSTQLGVKDGALRWFRSYLSNRSQRISVNGGLSEKFELNHGVPQGSCLGPMLFSIYSSKLFEIVNDYLPQVHCYADDIQLYLSFSPNASSNVDSAMASMTECITAIRTWMIRDKLKINDTKTEFILLGTRQQLAKVDNASIIIGSSEVAPVSSVRNLGAWFDSELSMSTHISKVCSSAFFYLHNIKRIRKYLSVETAEILVHAFITSRVDYCNSLLYGLPMHQLNKLQRVQNAAARVVRMVPRLCHITPVLLDLHWLPIRFRIQFKVTLFIFKALRGLAPQYLSNLLVVKSSYYNLRNSSDLLLSAPKGITKKTLGDRAFVAAAPKLWNALPRDLRQIDSIHIFKKQLKFHLFRLAYNN